MHVPKVKFSINSKVYQQQTSQEGISAPNKRRSSNLLNLTQLNKEKDPDKSKTQKEATQLKSEKGQNDKPIKVSSSNLNNMDVLKQQQSNIEKSAAEPSSQQSSIKLKKGQTQIHNQMPVQQLHDLKNPSIIENQQEQSQPDKRTSNTIVNQALNDQMQSQINHRSKSQIDQKKVASISDQQQQTTPKSNVVEYFVSRRMGLQFKKCFVKRRPNNEVIHMSPKRRMQTELEAYHQFKQNKDNTDMLYLINLKWIEKWIEFLKGNSESPDYINNEKLHSMIFEEGKSQRLKMNEDFILVHKQLFEYLNGIYGCDYFIQGKKYTRAEEVQAVQQNGNHMKIDTPSTISSSNKNHGGNDNVSSNSYISGGSSSWQRSSSNGKTYFGTINNGLSLAQRVEEQKKQLQQFELTSQLSDGIAGLQNYSYFCYLNSCLQCILAIEQFKKHFLLKEYSRFKDVPRLRNTSRLSIAFSKFYQDVWVKKNSDDDQSKAKRKKFLKVVLSPNSIKSEVCSKFSPVYQHDCHEFFTYVMSSLQDEETPIVDERSKKDPNNMTPEAAWETYEQTHPSIIDKLFSGMQKTIVTCGKCGNKSNTYNPFMTLSLAYESSLDKCLTNFLKEDTLDHRDQYKCEKCKQNSKAKIKTELSKLPNILVFHLKRFAFPSMKKIKGHVKFNTYINMDKYTKNSTLDADDTEYELFALTVHIGSLEGGHYIAYTKRNAKWYVFNDEDYEQVNEKEALNQEAYLLFYRKVTL